jgi:hypothetical protein
MKTLKLSLLAAAAATSMMLSEVEIGLAMEGSAGGPGLSRAEIEAGNRATRDRVNRDRLQNIIRGSDGRTQNDRHEGRTSGEARANERAAAARGNS